jgi:poly-gamma-glutamate synthesis protein (capsule biosynthesis protein)
MIFVGDIALPFKDSITLKNLPPNLKNKNWFGNLEGAIIDNQNNHEKESVVFNDKKAVKNLCSEFNFSGFALANNHIFDTGNIDETTSYLKEINIPYCGIGTSVNEANEPLILNEEGREVIILNFGWEVIQCEVNFDGKPTVNPLRKKHVLKSVSKVIFENPKAVVIPFMHWSYELEAEPQPFERELARQLIDLGAAGVIGCHPHRIGGYESYNGKPIVYSLGNWMFKQGYYHNGKIRFPEFCNKHLAFEWDFKQNILQFHFFDFDPQNSTLKFSHSEDSNSKTMESYTPFRNLNTKDYKDWYKKNHYHKNKGLPIYNWNDSRVQVKIKNLINKLRDFSISIILKIK